MKVVLALNHRMEPNYLSKSSNDDDHAECYGSVLMEGFHVMTSNLNAPSIFIFSLISKYSADMGRDGTEVTSALLFQLPRVRFLAFPRIYSFLILLRFINLLANIIVDPTQLVYREYHLTKVRPYHTIVRS